MKKSPFILICLAAALLTAAGVFIAFGSDKKPAANSSNVYSAVANTSSAPPCSTPSSSAVSASSQAADSNEFDANIKGVPVLIYHHFIRDKYKSQNKNSIIMPESEFESHLKALKENDYTALSLSQLMDYLKNGIHIPEKSVVLTFDDGYKSNVVIAAPLMRKYDFKGVVFAITDNYNGADSEYDESLDARQYVNKTDIEMSSDVFEYACHTDNLHYNLTEQPSEKIKADLLVNRAKINSPYFAYPIGYFDDRVIKIVKECGFTAAFTTVKAFAKTGVNLYQIPRFYVLSPISADEFINLVETGIKRTNKG